MNSTPHRGTVPALLTKVAAVSLTIAFGSCENRSSVDLSASGSDAGDSVNFMRDIKPILERKCVPCHNSEAISGRLNLESRKTAFGGSERGSFIVPGEPDSSLIYIMTAKPHDDGAGAILEKMPDLKGVFLNDKERELLKTWIENGAKWPGGDEGWLKPRKSRNGEV